ncbi:MAG: hypothetical protein M1825_001110 [Sarcosagium campestre]|nr:MAG: hypothetical protein M1825_001110 [Sarcosagium campestre]
MAFSNHRGYVSLGEKLRPRQGQRTIITRILFVVIALSALILLLPVVTQTPVRHGIGSLKAWTPGSSVERRPQDSWQKPEGLRVVGLVFFGRKRFVSILDCYLKRNLAVNGGILDEVQFIRRTQDKEDLAYLDELLASSSSYGLANVTDVERIEDYASTWDNLQLDKETIYIKIDDDVIFIEDNTLESMVKVRVEHPEYLAVSANSINNPALSWVHWHLGAIRPYLPEMKPPDESRADDLDWNRRKSWRASELPTWQGPDDHFIDFKSDFPAPFNGHRWLPLRKTTNDDNTPVNVDTYDKAGPGWNFWTIAAQELYSFLENLENDELYRYKFDVWDYKYDRLSINLIAIMGKDVIANRPFPSDDEQYLTVELPKILGRHSVVAGQGTSVHYSFRAQVWGHNLHALAWTDVLDRYRAYAEEKVCGIPR